MPFHIHGSQMNGFPLPSSFHLSLSSHPSPFAPHPPHSVPASFPQLLSRAGHNIRGGCVDGWEGGVWKRREQKENVYYGCDERRRQLLTYQHTVYVYRCVIRVRVCVCVCACAAVCLCDMPMWQSLATRRCCCSNDAVATTVWHLWRINIFHLDESYYPPLVVVEIQKKKLSSCSDCSAMFHLQHFTVKIRQTAFC